MSRKYFLFSGLTLMLLVGLYDLVSVIHMLSLPSSTSSGDIVAVIVLCLINLGLCIPSLILTINAFKKKQDSLVASVLLIIASTIYLGYRVFYLSRILQSTLHPGEPFELLFYWSMFALGQFIIGLLPVGLAIFSLFIFKKNEQDYVFSSKINSIFYYIVMTLALQAFILFSTTGIRCSVILSSSHTNENIAQAIIYNISSLAIIGLITPSFVMSFFKNKQKISHTLAFVAAIVVLAVHSWSLAITLIHSSEYSFSQSLTVAFLEMTGTVFECLVLVASTVLMLVRFKTKQPAQIKTELE